MNKTDDKFCPECGHHLYKPTLTDVLWCIECQMDVDEPATIEQVQAMRESYDSQVETDGSL